VVPEPVLASDSEEEEWEEEEKEEEEECEFRRILRRFLCGACGPLIEQ
jgi:hypothetical protein